MSPGTRVQLVESGRQGTVTAVHREPGCGCPTVVVRLDGGREWAGKPSEVRKL